MRNILINDYLDEIARKFPEKDAFADEKGKITFSELRNNARRIGKLLKMLIKVDCILILKGGGIAPFL